MNLIIHMDSSKKWWHVPDEQIEELVQKLSSSADAVPAHASATRTPNLSSASTVGRSVRFENSTMEDALDREMMQTALDTGTGPAPTEKGWWKVADEQLQEFVQKVAKASAEQSVDVGKKELLGPAGKMMMESDRRHKSHSMQQINHGKNSRAKQNLSARPKWDSHPASNLFAPVGAGLDGKGNKTIHPDGRPFANNSIFLADFWDPKLASVRRAVCGHPSYMRY